MANAEVWCNQCDQPSTIEVRLTNGQTVAKCDRHAWLLRAPRGRSKR